MITPIKLTFCLSANLSQGRGTEIFVLNMLKNKPDYFNITIVETDIYDKKRLLKKELENALKRCDLIELSTKSRKLIKVSDIIKINLFKQPAFSGLEHINEATLKKIRDTDIVYLLFNPFSLFFRGIDIPVIGSAHVLINGEDKRGIISSENHFIGKLKAILYIKTYFQINGYHSFWDGDIFPEEIARYHNLKYHMILPNGVDSSLFYPDYRNINRKVKLLFNASLQMEKGLDIILPLVNKFRNDENIEFHIAGAGNLESGVRNNKNLIYHGILNNEQLATLYRECDIFIYPSHLDAYPLVILQALSSGMYILCSDYLKGKFDEFENKYLEYVPLTLETFYDKINKIIEDRELIKHDKEEEYNYVKEHYSWEFISKTFYSNILNFYKQNK